ncbi:MAG TPA: S1/P1 nuclease [Gemmatimonadales bacterium]|nr:S1/P1 nuclease [Gemmatimonadales bacterium]
MAIVAGALLVLPASALWDAAGHRTVAAIAWEHMTPRARTRAVELLRHGPALANFASLRPPQGSEAARDRALFLNAATWADLVRSRDQAWHAYHHATWHYADFYWEVENGRPHDIPGTGPDSLNAAERIVVLRATLTDANAADTTKAVALAWLLHLVGDIHQPLHCSSRVTPDEPLPQGDKGGNTFRLDDDRNLHGYWDRILDASVAPDPGEDSIAYADRVAHRIEGTHSRASLAAPLAATDVLGWAQEGLRLAQTVVYAGVTRGSAPSAAYEAEALEVSEGRIALAGYRLAALLNAALQ